MHIQYGPAIDAIPKVPLVVWVGAYDGKSYMKRPGSSVPAFASKLEVICKGIYDIHAEQIRGQVLRNRLEEIGFIRSNRKD